MRKACMILLGLVLIVASVSCEQDPSFTVADIIGTWNFPDGSVINIMDENTIDIFWTSGETEYTTFIDGALDGNVFTGTYGYNTLPDIGSNVDLEITITITLSSNKLTATCSGQGPLNGKSFSAGTK